jgi:cytochrome P450
VPRGGRLEVHALRQPRSSEGVIGETFSWYDRENGSERGSGQEGEERMTSLDHERVDRLVRSFDHWAPELAVDPQSVYQALRDQCPVAHSDQHGGFWVLSRHEDIEAAARDAATFSSTSVSIPLEIGMGGLPIPPLDQDPPEHTRFRQQLLPFFSPARTLSLEPLTRRVAAELIEEFKDAGGCDVADAYARPVPIAVLAQILGIDPKDHELFTAWTTAIIEDAAADPDKAAKAGAELYAYFGELLAGRRRNPGDDLLSFLLGTDASDEERLGCAILLLLAGIDTTWSTLGSIFWYLAQDPDARHHIAQDESNMMPAVEELLRAFAPTSVARITTRETTVAGQRIPAGCPVLLPFPSANGDERAFSQPNRVVLDRSPNRHLAFGAGVHRCLGAHLARMELRVGIEEFLRRIPDFRLAGEDAVDWKSGPIRGPRRLELIFD